MAERMEYRGDSRTLPLSQLSDYQVADDSPDVRGWDVFASDRQQIGTVDDLLVDTERMKARYLVVELEDGQSAVRQGRTHEKVLVAAETTSLDEARHTVRIGIPAAQVALLPNFTGATPTDMGDGGVRAETMRPATGRDGEDTERRMTRSAEELSVRRREVPAGEVRVTKHVDTERVRQPVTRTREDVRVEQRPITESARTADIGEDEIRVPLTEEEVVVEKRPVAREEVVITKEQVEDTEMVEEDVRKERIDVERVGRPGETRPRGRR